VFDAIGKKWGELDILVHSIAFAPKEDLQGGLLDCSASGFATAMDISCHSFVRMAKLAAPLMKNGGTMMAMSYHGASKVVPTYSVMGPVKAALESCCRYLAYELGGKGIRVHAISPGPLKTRAASGLKDFDLLLTEARNARRSASWSTSWTWASPVRTWRRRMPGACRARRCTSTAASTSWRDAAAGVSRHGDAGHCPKAYRSPTDASYTDQIAA
jgi:enoyl-[acyl-carrier-protein] reductase (NADH)